MFTTSSKIVNDALESARQQATGDDQFFRKRLYFFELRTPPGATDSGGETTFRYPLVIPPESIEISEPFAIEETFTSGGGLFVEEAGIISRECTISGHTGWQPRENPGQSDFHQVLPPDRTSHTRKIFRRYDAVLRALSGQKHFQFLQDAVFRTYADLKLNPATAHGTELFFHIQKDGERWRCFPKSFRMTRSKDRPLHYSYEIKLLLVKGDGATDYEVTEDRPVLEALKDKVRVLRSGVGLLRAGIDDVTTIQDELDNIILQGAALISDVGNIATAAEDYLSGVQKVIRTPLAFVVATQGALNAGLSAISKASAIGGGVDVPGSLMRTLRQVEDGLLMLATYPELFETDIAAAVQTFNERQSFLTSRSNEALAAAGNSLPPSTIRGFGAAGSALLPGDARRASTDIGLGSAVPVYTSAQERTVESGDSLASLAARYLGDAREWKILAAFNNLRPPYISEQRLFGTLRVGDKLLIPTFGASVNSPTSFATLGVSTSAPIAERLLGTDLRLREVSPNQADLEIDTLRGSVDVRTVVGLENLTQGIHTRLRTERGRDTLYRSLGVRRLVGTGLSSLDLESAQFAMLDTLEADARVATVRAIRFGTSQARPDNLEAELDVVVRGFSETQTVVTPL